jgi:hypothetical protein
MSQVIGQGVIGVPADAIAEPLSCALEARSQALPELDRRGLLPPGLHHAHFEQVALMFGTTPWRRRLLADLKKWAESELQAGAVEAMLIGGSFVSNKPAPEDIDVTVIFDKEAGVDAAARLKADTIRIWQRYRIDALPNAGQFFQFVGEKGAALHGCRPTDLRGLVSVASWFRDTEQVRNLGLLAKWAA